MKSVQMPVIGIIRTPYTRLEDIPRQSILAMEVTGRAELFPEYAEGLRNVDEFRHIYLYFHFHLAGKPEMVTKSRYRGREMGVFATRSPMRPSRMGVSEVEVVSVDRSAIVFRGVDMLDKTPLLDIKPCMDKEE